MSNGSGNDVLQSMKQSIVGRVPVLGTSDLSMDCSAWRIIPFSKCLVAMVSKSPKQGCSPYKWPKWLINGGY